MSRLDPYRAPLLFVWMLASLAGAYEPAATGRWAVATSTGSWTDAARDRAVPFRVYRPEEAAGPLPVVLVSHGLGGDRDGYAYLGRAWASHGYLVLHIQHLGSDDVVWRATRRPLRAMRAAAADYRTALDRAKDVTFAVDQLTRDASLAPLVDTNHMGIAGHSFGSWTVLAAAGLNLGPLEDRLAERRLHAGLAMSSPVPRGADAATYQAIHMPLLHMTGTKDVSVINDTTAAQRRVPYDRIAASNQYLVVFTGGDHLVFSGRGRQKPDPRDVAFQDLIVRGSLAFWDAFLREDPAARAWLNDGAYKAALGRSATWEGK